jgi:hypothetical protein
MLYLPQIQISRPGQGNSFVIKTEGLKYCGRLSWDEDEDE